MLEFDLMDFLHCCFISLDLFWLYFIQPYFSAGVKHPCWNQCLLEGWKKAIIIAIFKKGKSYDSDNYRPISLTCMYYKLFEAIIKKNLFNHFSDHNLLTIYQHGFILGHSTCTNLLDSLNLITSHHDNSIPTVVSYIDFLKCLI